MKTSLLLVSLALSTAACSGGGLVGSRDPDAGSEPDQVAPTDDCDAGLVSCGGTCRPACASPDAGARDVATTTDVTSVGKDGGTDGPPPSADATPPPADGPPSTEYSLYVTIAGFGEYDGEDIHEFAMDTTTDDSWASCGGGGAMEGGGEPQTLNTNTLIAGHTYSFDYWFDTSNFTFCGSGPYAPVYYEHAFGPVTGDVYITLTPADPTNM